MNALPVTGLVLSGGGARAAYQVGVLQAIAGLRREQAPAERHNPFPVIVGTSAGAINAAALACGADDFDATIGSLAATWGAMHAAQVYRADAWGVARTGARWLSLFSVGWAFARWKRARPKSLLDNSPLAELLDRLVPLERLPALMQAGHLQALAITASDYSSGEHVTFYDSIGHCAPWTRSQRLALRSPISHAHLLASSAIPFVFPAVALPLAGRTQYFGDGSMRQVAPISPAVHLGAQRIVVVGAGRLHEPGVARPVAGGYPSLAQIAGHALSSIFLDALAVDIERLRRINSTLALLPPEARERTPLRPIELLVVSPSQRLDDIAARHVQALPAPVRAMLRATGVHGDADAALPTAGGGAALASYLLFERDYTRELMALGAADVMARREEVLKFFGWPANAATTQRDAGVAGASAPA
ncbi:patatin-like phospholipase family protein [Rivibacter subsaxonicus]|uniref:NTE family protein n=1 Tax=Rivibacter subsaxonicus TaxID=457575 RepID=A0A4Q7W241_9BURK|nr:patatin-like phospholipase family protein [Rivibacter subsaxonicus]RZU02639.1 NTE family protein [Rivibacter subsaxonicus]